MNDHQNLHKYPLHNPILEVVHGSNKNIERGAKALDEAGLVKTGVRALTGGRAFREYSWLADAVRLATIAGTAAQRTLLGIVPVRVHLAYRSLEGWCMMAGLVGETAQSVSSRCVDTIQRADTLVHSTFKTVTDTRNQAQAVWWVIEIVLSLRSKR
jgi:hypothetical protein